MDKINKFILPATILIGAVVLGGFIYASQLSKQKSIEKQQQLELQAKTTAPIKINSEQTKKEYLVKRKKDCYDLETSERKKWNNVDSSNYNEFTDKCVIRYKDLKPKSEKECDEIYPRLDGLPFMAENMLCKEGKFYKEF